MKKHPKTAAVRAGVDCDRTHGAVMPPVYLTANFSFDGLDGKRPYDYTRTGNPTRDLLAGALAELEGGAGAVVTSSGMSAAVLATYLLHSDDLLIAPHNCYGGCYRAFDSLAGAGRFRSRFMNFGDLPGLQAACDELRPRMIWVETPSNPLLRVTDIREVSQIAHRCGALLVVDNTFLTPLLQQPIALGAHLVVHSTTKYINGHSDVVGGAVIAADPALHEQLAWWANCVGSTASPFDCSQTLRGIRTLDARLRSHQENAAQVVAMLAAHPGVKAVHYPGLETHPDHAIASRQQAGFGAIVSFELAGGERQLRAFFDGLSLFTLAESLGGVESLACHPASMTHAAMAPGAQLAAGIGPNLVRLSVGIEHGADLVRDLEIGLERAVRTRKPWLNVASIG